MCTLTCCLSCSMSLSSFFLPPFFLSLSLSFLPSSPCSLLLTTFCLEHSPMTVACVCIHLSCHWKGIDIPRSSDGKNWWEYIDTTINKEKIDVEGG